MSKKEKYTFKQWCLDNNRYDLLNRWDYELTGFGPNDITYASNKDVYFKCPEGIHASAKRKVFRVTNKNSDQKDFKCVECLSGKAINFQDLTNMVFGELTVLHLDYERNQANKNTNNNQTYWICQCSCGAIASAYAASLKSGSQKTCGNKSIHYIGENNNNWRGGVTPKYISERTSKEYIAWRNAVYAKDWYTCQCCGAYGDDIEKNAHHIINFSEYDELKYDVNNSITLCAKCHHIKYKDSFHDVYGIRNNNANQLEQYINYKRNQLGINIPFTIEDYKNGNILNKNSIAKYYEFISKWKFVPYLALKSEPIKRDNGFIKIKPKSNIKED